jgi:hypothetical protein
MIIRNWKNFEYSPHGREILKEELMEIKEKINKFNETEIKIKYFDLVNSALKATKVNNSYVQKFENLIEEDFKEICDIETTLNNAKAIDTLRLILKKLQLISNCPELHNKTFGAIGGRFSSGKSSFVNSFITDSAIKLAEGTRPVAVIPSYIISSDKPQVNGISCKGGSFEIALDIYKDISPEVLKTFGYNLREIIPYTIMLCPLQQNLFRNICLINIPEYNPSVSDSSSQNFEAIKEYVEDSQFLIWTISLDKNDTIPKYDLEFLSQFDFEKNTERKLYILANKAELKTQDDLEDILDTFEERLEDMGINYAGICTYSSNLKKTYTFRKSSIIEFLSEQNASNPIYGTLADMLDDVFDEYYLEINHNIKANEKIRKEVKTIALDTIEIEVDTDSDAYDVIDEEIDKLIDYFAPEDNLEDRVEKHNQIYWQFLNCLNAFCDDMGIDRTIARKLRKTPDELIDEDNSNEEAKEMKETELLKALKKVLKSTLTSLEGIVEKYSDDDDDEDFDDFDDFGDFDDDDDDNDDD